MLDHDGHVGLDDAGVVGGEGHWLRVNEIIETHVLGAPGPTVSLYGPTGSRSLKYRVIRTWASVSEVFSKHAVSWLVKSCAGPVLHPGM